MEITNDMKCYLGRGNYAYILGTFDQKLYLVMAFTMSMIAP